MPLECASPSCIELWAAVPYILRACSLQYACVPHCVYFSLFWSASHKLCPCRTHGVLRRAGACAGVDPAPSDGPGAWPFRVLGVGASPATVTSAPAVSRPRTAPLRCDSAFAPSHKRNVPAARGAEQDGPPLLSALKPGLDRLPSVSTISSSLDELETDIDLDEPAGLTHSASYSFGDLKENIAPNEPAVAAPDFISACRAGGGGVPSAAPAAWGCAPKGAGLLRASSGGEGVLRKGEQPDGALALFMAQCAALAYARAGAAEAAVRGWGLHWEGSCGMERGGGAQQGGGALRPSWCVRLPGSGASFTAWGISGAHAAV